MAARSVLGLSQPLTSRFARILGVLAASAGIFAAGCERQADSASVLLLVSPDLILAKRAGLSENTFSIAFTASFREGAGVGATVQVIDFMITDTGTQRILVRGDLDEFTIKTQKGTAHLAPNGRLDVSGFTLFGSQPAARSVLSVNAHLLDDLGNSIITSTTVVPIQLP